MLLQVIKQKLTSSKLLRISNQKQAMSIAIYHILSKSDCRNSAIVNLNSCKSFVWQRRLIKRHIYFFKINLFQLLPSLIFSSQEVYFQLNKNQPQLRKGGGWHLRATEKVSAVSWGTQCYELIQTTVLNWFKPCNDDLKRDWWTAILTISRPAEDQWRIQNLETTSLTQPGCQIGKDDGSFSR